MSDFDSSFWSLFVAGATVVSIVACALLLMSLSRRKAVGDPDKTGHVWDEDLDELNNPLPMWWIWLFWATIALSAVYLWFYPGLGAWEGAGKWSSLSQYREEVAAAERQHGPLYARFAATDVALLARDPEARLVGERLFLTYCSQCHAADARGAKGFPNLRDADWLYGGDPQAIRASILDGRKGVMPPMGAVVGPDGAKDMASYVRSLSGLAHDPAAAKRAQPKFAVCAACHGPDGKGNPAIGAPNLTDAVWLYGSSEATLVETIVKGRTNQMPAHRAFLGEQRAHILAAYVYGLSQAEKPALLPVATTKR